MSLLNLHLVNFMIIILVTGIASQVVNKTKTLHLIGLIPIDVSKSFGWSAAGILPALQMGFSDINQRSDILKDYHLEISWGDTEAS